MIDWMNGLKGWRTWLANIVMMILPILELTEWREVLPEGYVPYYVIAVAVVNMAMRAITTTPLGKK